MLKAKKGFILRKLGTEYMVVAIGEASKSFNGMIRMNETGAFYWKELEKGTTEEQLVEQTLKQFQGLDRNIAAQDIKEFLSVVSIAVENEN